MFKLFEKDKCVTLQLDLTTSIVTLGHTVNDIVPGTILYDGPSGALDALGLDADGNGADGNAGAVSITEATAGLFYIAMDYYPNTLIHSYSSSPEPGAGQYSVGSGKITAIPVLEYFTAIIPLNFDMSKGDVLTIAAGVWAEAGTEEYAFAMVSEDNNWDTANPADTKITTWCARYTTPAQ